MNEQQEINYNEIYYEIDRTSCAQTDKKTIRLRSKDESIDSLITKAKEAIEK